MVKDPSISNASSFDLADCRGEIELFKNSTVEVTVESSVAVYDTGEMSMIVRELTLFGNIKAVAAAILPPAKYDI